MPCQEHLVEVAEQQRDFDALHVATRVITFAAPAEADEYRQSTGLGYALLCDPDRRAYAAYGLGRGSLLKVWNPRLIGRYLIRILQGRRLRRPRRGDDRFQLGGDFIIDAEGKLAFAHRSETPQDRPTVPTLLAALRNLPQTA